LSFQLGSKSNLIVEGDLTIMERNEPGSLPVIGTILPNPNGEIPDSFNPSGPADVENLVYNGRVGYEFEHEFNENLTLRNAYTDTKVVEDIDIPEGNRLYNAPENAINLWTT
jgi:iron complex outermembrane recepter protein